MTYLAKNIEDEDVDFSPKAIKQMVVKLYAIPIHTDKDAGILMDACDMMYAQMEEIKRLRGCAPALQKIADLPLRNIRPDKPDVRSRIRLIAIAALKRLSQ